MPRLNRVRAFKSVVNVTCCLPLKVMLHGLGSIRDDIGDRSTRSSSSTNKPNMKKEESDDGKQRSRQNNLFCPASSCCPGEVRGFATSLWSSDGQYCANRRARVKEDSNELAKRGKNLKTNLPWRLVGEPHNQFLPRQTQKFLKKNVLQKSSIKTSAPSFRELQTNACSLRELKSKEEDVKATLMLPKMMHQNQQLHAVFSEKAQTMERVEWNPLRDDGLWSLTPWVENVSDDEWCDEWFEEVTGQVELQKNETKKDNSFQASTRPYVSLPKIETPKQNALPKTEYSVKQLNSSVLPFPLLRYRRLASDKTLKGESLTLRAPLRSNLKAIKPEFAAQE